MTENNATWSKGMAALIMVDTKGIIRHWNEQAEELFGYSATATIGKSMEIFIPDSYIERHWVGFNKAMENSSVTHDPLIINSPVKCSDGSVKLYPGREILVLDAFGAAVGALAIFSPECEAGVDNGLTSMFLDALT